MKIQLIIISFILLLSCNRYKIHKDIKTPDEALAELKIGNDRFIKELSENNRNFKEQIEHTKIEQHPHTFVLSCIDSRVPPEIIFDQALGQLFVARVAGNVDDDYIIASMEFAIKIKHTKLIVVLGHNHCGAVIGAIHNIELEHLTELTNQIKPSINSQNSYPIENDISTSASKRNVYITVQHLTARSKILYEAMVNKEIKIVGAYYNIESGKVDFL